MNLKTAEAKLKKLGFQLDLDTLVKMRNGYWEVVMDALGRGQIDGDCRGEVVTGDTKAELLDNCVEVAEEYAEQGPNTVCEDDDCDFHGSLE